MPEGNSFSWELLLMTSQNISLREGLEPGKGIVEWHMTDGWPPDSIIS